MEHYFTKQSTTEKVTQTIEYYINEQKLSFITSNAVFSKSYVDYGSNHLIRWFLSENKNAAGDLLDVGCGYGPIGITLAKFLPDIQVTMIDINERAIELAKENAARNNVEGKTTILQSDRFESVTGEFDYILTNPPIRAGKSVVHAIYEEAYQHLKSGGRIYSVLQKKQGAPSSQEKMEALFGNCSIKSRDAGYYILESIKNR